MSDRMSLPRRGEDCAPVDGNRDGNGNGGNAPFSADELLILKRAYAEGKASGDGKTVDPHAFLEQLKVKASPRG